MTDPTDHLVADATPVGEETLTEETDTDETSTSSTSTDPRHQKRAEIMQALFAEEFSADQVESDLPHIETAKKILAEATEIDPMLQAAAPERPIKDINKVDLAILRLIVFESNHKKTPKKVLLNEAVELAKEYGTESSPAFVNAVLGQIILPEGGAEEAADEPKEDN